MSLWPELKSSNSIQTVTLDDCLFHWRYHYNYWLFSLLLCLSHPPSLPVPHDSLVHCCCVDVQPCSCHLATNQPQGAPTIYLASFLLECAYGKCSRCSGPASLHHQCNGWHKWERREARVCACVVTGCALIIYLQHHMQCLLHWHMLQWVCMHSYTEPCTLTYLSKVLRTYVRIYVVWAFTSGLCQWAASTCPSLYRTNSCSRTVFRRRLVRAIPSGPDWLYSVQLLCTYWAIGQI